jgi:hypothetical protein
VAAPIPRRVGKSLSRHTEIAFRQTTALFVSGMLYWMPTTGEFGPGAGFGDYEYHEDFATLLGVHFTYSREDAQEQPGVNAFENSQIRLSDGTLFFAPNAFNTGGMIAGRLTQSIIFGGWMTSRTSVRYL